MAGSAPGDCVYIDLSGASSGIGEATAIKLAEHGARLFLVALEEDKLQNVQQKCKEKGLVEEKIGYCSGDLSQSTFREEIVRNLVQKFGRLDILNLYLHRSVIIYRQYVQVLAIKPKKYKIVQQLILPYKSSDKADIAGHAMFLNISETKEEDYDRLVNVNQKAKLFLAQLCLPCLKETKGNIIYMSSIASTIPYADNSAKQAHLKRVGKPEDVVSLLLFLASDEASYITGSITNIDGRSHLYP